jgi:hypothetical protein
LAPRGGRAPRASERPVELRGLNSSGPPDTGESATRMATAESLLTSRGSELAQEPRKIEGVDRMMLGELFVARLPLRGTRMLGTGILATLLLGLTASCAGSPTTPMWTIEPKEIHPRVSMGLGPSIAPWRFGFET